MPGAFDQSVTHIDSCHPQFLHHKSARMSAGNKLRVAMVQLAVGADKALNIKSAAEKVADAASKGARLVMLPECFNSPYGTQYFAKYAEEVPGGETCVAMREAAARARVCLVAGSVPEREGARLYNTCCVWGPDGSLLAKHRKVHLFDIDIPGKMTFKESAVLTAGDALTAFEYDGVKIGLGICYDLRFPEMARLYAAQGCKLLVYPGAFNMTTGPRHWELLGRARAVDCQLWVALVSPARDAAAAYVAWGHSALLDPWGAVHAQLQHEPEMMVADLDMDAVDEVRRMIPIGSQRRTDLYDTVSRAKP